MSNHESKQVKDTRGRPRTKETKALTLVIRNAYLNDELPLTLPASKWVSVVRAKTKQLRNSVAFQEMEKELRVKFRLLPAARQIEICLRRDSQ